MPSARASRNLTIENRSGQAIDLLQATVGDEPNTFRNVAAGVEVSAPCRAKDGDRFALDGRLEDGTRIRAKGTVGDSLHFIVLPGGEVKLRPRGMKSP